MEADRQLTVSLRAGYVDGKWVHEEVRVNALDGKRFVVLQSPGLVLDLAAHDIIDVDEKGEFVLVRRGGNVAIQVFCEGEETNVARHLGCVLGSIGGRVDGVGDGVVVVTVPARSGFHRLEEAMNAVVVRFPDAKWFYGNVYEDDEVTPKQWVSSIREHSTSRKNQTQHWRDFSRQCVEEAEEKRDTFMQRYGIRGASFSYDLDSGHIKFDTGGEVVTARICVVGTTSTHHRTFCWSWANPAIPLCSTPNINVVRQFGERHNAPLLIDAEWVGGHPEALEMLCIAVHILEAEGMFIDQESGIYMALLSFDEAQLLC